MKKKIKRFCHFFNKFEEIQRCLKLCVKKRSPIGQPPPCLGLHRTELVLEPFAGGVSPQHMVLLTEKCCFGAGCRAFSSGGGAFFNQFHRPNGVFFRFSVKMPIPPISPKFTEMWCLGTSNLTAMLAQIQDLCVFVKNVSF